MNDLSIDLSKPIHVQLKPGARSAQIVYNGKNKFTIKIHEKPVGGQANKALIKILAIFLKIPKSNIILIKGLKSRAKTLIIK